MVLGIDSGQSDFPPVPKAYRGAGGTEGTLTWPIDMYDAPPFATRLIRLLGLTARFKVAGSDSVEIGLVESIQRGTVQI